MNNIPRYGLTATDHFLHETDHLISRGYFFDAKTPELCEAGCCTHMSQNGMRAPQLHGKDHQCNQDALDRLYKSNWGKASELVSLIGTLDETRELSSVLYRRLVVERLKVGLSLDDKRADIFTRKLKLTRSNISRLLLESIHCSFDSNNTQETLSLQKAFPLVAIPGRYYRPNRIRFESMHEAVSSDCNVYLLQASFDPKFIFNTNKLYLYEKVNILKFILENPRNILKSTIAVIDAYADENLLKFFNSDEPILLPFNKNKDLNVKELDLSDRLMGYRATWSKIKRFSIDTLQDENYFVSLANADDDFSGLFTESRGGSSEELIQFIIEETQRYLELLRKGKKEEEDD